MSLMKSGPAYDAEYHSGMPEDDDRDDYMSQRGPQPPTRRDYWSTPHSAQFDTDTDTDTNTNTDTAHVMKLLDGLRFEH